MVEIKAATMNPAIKAAEESLRAIYDCLDGHKSFLLEAGAGSGKTYSLIKALRYLIDKYGADFIRRNEQIACITYTNVATDEIKSRIDSDPAVFSSTIHAFCWSLIKGFQPFLRQELPTLSGWAERLDEGGGIAGREIEYDLGFASARKEDKVISLHHDDVLTFMVKLMEQPKFRRVFVARYPVLFIDEYQDTDKNFVAALQHHFLGKDESPLIGFFGDHWQKIYGDESCGKIEHGDLTIIEHKSNFRSVEPIVDVLNHMRPELPQACSEPGSEGVAVIYHTNEWAGERRAGRGGHWTGDLPEDEAHTYLESLRAKLTGDGWDFSADKTKILMLTHGVLAAEQGYSGIAKVFPGQRSAAFLKKEDRHIKFFLEVVEPVSVAYENKRFGEMFMALDAKTPAIQSHADKVTWQKDMDELLKLRAAATIGAVLDYLKSTKRPRLPDAVERRERELEQWVSAEGVEEPLWMGRLRSLREIPYKEVTALARFIDEHTPFSTKHGVKGAEFQNVLVIAGRGWNLYNFNQLLEWFGDPASIPADRAAFERNRNLFYVACSRPKKRLAVLFTQKLSGHALATLSAWFGDGNVYSFKP